MFSLGMTRNKSNNYCTIFREEATSADFHVGSLSWLNLNLVILVFVEEGAGGGEGAATEKLEKNPLEQGEEDGGTTEPGSHC